MPIAYFAAGATSFVASNWSDATGFADNAELVARLTGQDVTGGVDQSTHTTGIRRFLVPNGSSGSIGTSAAPLRVDIDATTGVWDSANPTRARLEVFATGGQYYFRAGGASGVISNVFGDTGGSVYLVGGGIHTTLRLTRGSYDIDTNTNLGTLYAWAPANGIIRAKTSALTDAYFYSGSSSAQWIINRAASGSINVYAGMTVRYNVTSGTTATVNMLGGTFIHEAGDITTFNGTSGEYRARLERAATIATFNRELPFAFFGEDPLLTITASVGFHPSIDL